MHNYYMSFILVCILDEDFAIASQKYSRQNMKQSTKPIPTKSTSKDSTFCSDASNELNIS